MRFRKPMRDVLRLLALLPLWAGAAEVTVTSVVGNVFVQNAGVLRGLKAGNRLQAPLLLIKTDAGAAVQLRNPDGVQVSAGENTQIGVNDDERWVSLVRGQVALWSNDQPWRVDAAGIPLRMQGFLRLKTCGEGCAERPGVYGKGHGGDVVSEYPGGRTTLRERLFFLPAGGGKPELLARDTGFLSAAPGFDAALAAKKVTARDIQDGLDAFKAGSYGQAQKQLLRVRANAPGEVIVSYYLGLIALEEQRSADALRELQRYAREDAQGATERGVAKLLTLLTSDELQREVASAMAQEQAITSVPPESGTIAVQAFVSRDTSANSALAKGMAAMVISDLSKVPGLKVLERQKVQKISDEIRLSASGLVDANSVVRAGRLLRAERVLVGSMEFE